MSRSRRFVAGVSLGYAYQALVLVAGLWLTPFLLSKLGQQNLGLWLVATQVLAYLGLLDFGILALLPRQLAYITGRSGSTEKDLQDAIATTLRLVIWQLPVVVIAAFGVCIWFPEEWTPLRDPFAIVLVGFVILFPFRIFQTVLTGLQELAFVGKATLGAWTVTTVGTVLFLIGGFGLYALALSWTAGQLFSVIACYFRLRLHHPGVLPRRPATPDAVELWDQLRRGGWVSVSQVAQVLLYGSDLVVLGHILGPAAIVPYSCTSKLLSVLSNQPALLVQSAGPGLSELRTSGSRAKLLEVSLVITQGMLLASGAIAAVVLLVNKGFVHWWIGASQHGGQGLEVLFVMAMILRHWNTTLVYALFCFGRERRTSITTVVDGAITIAAAIALTFHVGLYATPVAGLIGVCTASLPANMAALVEETGTNASEFMLRLWPWFWRFSLLCCVLVYASSVWMATGLLEVGAAGAGVMALYGIVMLPILRGPVLSPYVLPRWKAMQSRISIFVSREQPAKVRVASAGGPKAGAE